MKRAGLRHPKLYELARLLKKDRPAAIGYLELLWDFAANYAPEGDIGRYSPERIEAALDWRGRQGHLLDCLVQSGWVDRCSIHTYLVHGWADHADRSTLARLSRAGKKPIQPNQEDTAEVCAQRAHLTHHNSGPPVPVPVPVPVPEPEPHMCEFAPHTLDDFGGWPESALPDDWQERIARAASGWPTPSGIERGKALMREAVMQAGDKPATLAMLELHIPGQAAYYRRNGARYVKSLANVMRDGDWMHPAPADPEEASF